MRISLLPLLGALLATAFSATGASAQDFNADGWGDNIIGHPFDDVSSFQNAGSVVVNFAFSHTEVLTQPPATGVVGIETWAQFGHATTWGDYDADGFHDLAVGAPAADVNRARDAGAVTIYYGDGKGLFNRPQAVFHQDSPGVGGVAETGDGFGRSLATGDFNGDGVDDLIIGVPFEDVHGVENTGIIQFLFGAKGRGITSNGSVWYSQRHLKNSDGDELWDFFGWTLAAGDFGGDGVDDVAIGVPYEDLGRIADAGAVYELPCTTSGPQPHTNQMWTQDVTGVSDDPEERDHFGWSLASGDFDFVTIGGRDEHDDLAIGVPNEDIGRARDAGAVHLLFGDPKHRRLGIGFQWFFHQGMNGAWGETPNNYDAFGYSLAAMHRFDGTAGLAIGVPFEDTKHLADYGVVHLLSRAQVSFVAYEHRSVTLRQTTDWINSDRAESGDRFGYSLAGTGITRVNSSTGTVRDQELLVGSPYEDVGFVVDCGTVTEIADESYVGLTWSREALTGEPLEAKDLFAAQLSEN